MRKPPSRTSFPGTRSEPLAMSTLSSRVGTNGSPAVPDRDDEPPRAVVCADAAPAVLVVLEVVVVLGALARVLWPSDLDTWATILAALMDGPRWPGGAPPGSGTGALGSEGSVSLTPG